jgi:hypothetical protein
MFGLFCRGSVVAASYFDFPGWSQSQKLQTYLWVFSVINIVLIGLEKVAVIWSPLAMWGLVVFAVAIGTYSHYRWDEDCCRLTPFFRRVEAFYAAVDYVLVLASVWALGVSAYATLLNPMLLILSVLFIGKRVLRMCLLTASVESVLRDILLALMLLASLYCYLGDATLLQRAPLRIMQFLPDMGFFICLCYHETPDSQAMFSLANIASWPKYMVYMFF